VIGNKKVWITGGGSGIGREVALALARAGNVVVISGRNEDKLAEVKTAFEAGNRKQGKIISIPFDVSRDDQVDGMTKILAEQLGHLDLAILSAGVCEYVENAELDTALFRRVFDANIFGVVNASSVALRLMRSQKNNNAKKPQLVLISSLSTYTGLPRAEAYGASKAAVDYFGDSLSVDLSKQGIDVSVIQPGFVDTPMTTQNDFAMPFEMSAESAAQKIVKAIDNRKRLYGFPWKLLWLIRVSRSIPFLWYRYIAPSMVKSKRNHNA